MDQFYVSAHEREDHRTGKKMELPLHSTFVDPSSMVHKSNFSLESPSKQHSSLAESIDNVVSATTPTCNPMEPLMDSVPQVEAVEQRGGVLPQPIGEQPVEGHSPDGSPTLKPKRLHVSNIPFRYREHDLRTLFGVGLFCSGSLYVIMCGLCVCVYYFLQTWYIPVVQGWGTPSQCVLLWGKPLCILPQDRAPLYVMAGSIVLSFCSSL